MTPENSDILDLRKLPLNQRAIYSAARIRAEMPGKGIEVELISRKNSSFLDLPVLGDYFKEVAPFWVPRYEPITGFVYSTKWGDVKTKLENEIRTVVKPKNYKFIDPQMTLRINLRDIPKSYKVRQIIPQKMTSIEDLLRQQDEIAHDHAFTGSEGSQITRLMAGVSDLAERYLQGTSVNTGTLKEMSKEIRKLIKKEGINVSETKILDDFTDYLKNSAKKIQKKPNYLISLTRAQAALLVLVRREVNNHLITDKARRIFWTAFQERAKTRSGFKQVADILKKFISANKIPSFEDLKEIRSLAFDEARVAPYHLHAAIAQVMLRDNKKYPLSSEEKKKIRKILSNGNSTSVYKEFSPMSELIEEGNPQKIFDRLRQVASFLEAILEDPDHDEITVFE